MYRQTHEIHKPFKPIILLVVLIRGNLEKFISIIHNLCLLILSVIKCSNEIVISEFVLIEGPLNSLHVIS
jgi:hypothetical protein